MERGKKLKRWLTVSCLAPLIPRIWLILEPLSAGALSGAVAFTATHVQIY